MGKSWGPSVLDEIRKGELTYAGAVLRAPYASRKTKAKWKDAEVAAGLLPGKPPDRTPEVTP